MTQSDDSRMKVIIAERHHLIRLGLCHLIENQPDMQLLASVDCFEELLALAEYHHPDILIICHCFEDDSGLADLKTLLQAFKQAKILTMAPECDDEILLKLFHLGIDGHIDKSLAPELILKAIDTIRHGQLWFDRRLPLLVRNRNPLHQQPKTHDFAGLTQRETSVALMAMQGLPAKRIATVLGLSEKTVRNQLTVVYAKLQVSNQLELCLLITRQQDCENYPDF